MDYKNVFYSFVDKSHIHQYMCQPFKRDGYYWATDGCSLIYMSCDKINLPFLEQDKPNPIKVIAKDFHEPIIIDVESLKSKMIGTLIDEYDEPDACDRCKGEGDIECDLGHMHECPQCTGDGYKERRKKTGIKILDTNQGYLFLETGLSQYYLDQLILTARMLDQKTIYKVAGGGKYITFKVGEAYVMIGGLYQEYSSNFIPIAL